MPSRTLERLLDHLDELKRRFGTPEDQTRIERALARLARRRFTDAASLIRFHDALLFIRAYPPGPAILRQTEAILSSFTERIAQLRAAGAEDLSAFAEPEVSGIVGTSFSALYSYDIVRWLAGSHPGRVRLDWEGYEEGARLGATLPRFLPLFEEGAYVETPIPYLTWLRAAKGPKNSELAWLLRRFAELPISDKEKAELFDSLKLWVHWELGNSPATRTKMRQRVSKMFYHDGPLLRRSDVSLARELEQSPPLPLRKLSRAAGEKILRMGRDTMAIRYRELHGFTYGDPRHVLRAEAGRGIEIFIWGVPPARRLPLHAYTAALIFKNGVPIGYAEGLSLFERMECGLNIYYTFRDGESAWLFARLLRLFRQFHGVTVFSIDPYQLGFANEEGIESGAFWFYRKLGFRPVRPDLARIMSAEERKIASRPAYRTPVRVLRRLAVGHVLFELPSARQRGEWDHFHIRNLGLAVQRRMASRFGGDAVRIRSASEAAVARALGAPMGKWKESERRAFSDLALVLALVPDLAAWSEDEKRAVTRIVRAKAGAEESAYVRLLQRHARLRDKVIELGSRSSSR